MAISSQTSQFLFAGNESTVTPYSLQHLRFDEDEWLHVEKIGADRSVTPLTLGVHYTITGDGKTADAGLVTISAPLLNSERLRVSRNTPLVQDAALVANGEIPSATLERMADWRVMALIDEQRRQKESSKRALHLPDGELLLEAEEHQMKLSSIEERRGKYIGFDAQGKLATFTGTEIAATVDSNLADLVSTAVNAANEADISASEAATSAGQAAASVLVVAPTIERNPGNLLNLRKHLRALMNRSGTPGVIGLAATGDSIAHTGGPWHWLTASLIQIYGLGGLLSATLENSRYLSATFDAPGLTPVVTGGATLYPPGGATGSYLYTPTGYYFLMPSGSTVTEAPRNPTLLTHWASVKAIYGVKTGGGSLQFQLKINGTVVATKTVSTAPGAVNSGAGTSTNGSAGTINTVEFVAADGLPLCGSLSLVTSCSTAESHYIGTFVKREKGVISVSFGRGGNSYIQHQTIPDATWTQLAAIFNIQAWCHAQKGEAQAAIDTHLDKMKLLFPGKTHICIGNAPVQVDPGNLQKTERDYWLTAAMRNNFYFNNGWDYFSSWAEISALGFAGDNVHLSTEARILWAEDILNKIRVNSPIGDTGNGDNALAIDSEGQPMTARDWAMMNVIGSTTRIFPLLSDAADSALPAGMTKNLSKGIFMLNNSTAAAANTIGGVEIGAADSALGYDNFAWRFELNETFTNLYGTPSPNGFIKIAMQTGFPVLGNINAAGIVWELGCDTQPIPWVRFHLSDGTNHQTSEKFHLNVTSETTGYNLSGYTRHRFVVIYRNTGTLTKQLECWIAPNRSSQNPLRAEKPFLCALWRPTVAQHHVWNNTVEKLSFNIGSRTTAPATNWSAQLLHFEKDSNIAPDSSFRNRPWVY